MKASGSLIMEHPAFNQKTFFASPNLKAKPPIPSGRMKSRINIRLGPIGGWLSALYPPEKSCVLYGRTGFVPMGVDVEKICSFTILISNNTAESPKFVNWILENWAKSFSIIQCFISSTERERESESEGNKDRAHLSLSLPGSGLLLVGIVFRGREIACLAAELEPPLTWLT